MANYRLSPQMKAFCDYYIETSNATESYKRAYPTCKADSSARASSVKLLAKDNIQEYLKARMEQIESERVMDLKEVLERLTRAGRGQIYEEVPIVVGEGDGFSRVEMVKKQISAKDQLKALELMGKKYKAFADKMDIDVKQITPIIDDI